MEIKEYSSFKTYQINDIVKFDTNDYRIVVDANKEAYMFKKIDVFEYLQKINES